MPCQHTRPEANGCRYCTLHQVAGLRRLGVEPAKLIAMQKDDSMLDSKERASVLFARKLTRIPSEVSTADFAALRKGVGSDREAMEALLQTCAFNFMNRFTDGLSPPRQIAMRRLALLTIVSKPRPPTPTM